MPSVQYDSVEIVTTTYVPRFIKHESTPIRIFSLLELAREDGSVLIAEKYGEKTIYVSGNIKASTQSNLEVAIDTFKELFSRLEKNLDISWGGTTRRYVATCVRHEFNRDYMHINFVPWTAEFLVVAGVGKDTALTAVLNASAVDLAAELSSAVTLAGSAKPKPIFTVQFNAAGWAASGAKGIELTLVSTGERMIYNRSAGLANTISLVFDLENKKATYSGSEVSFYGVFPAFIIGSNSFKIRAGGIIDQQFVQSASASLSGEYSIYGTSYIAQSFSVPYKDATYRQIDVYVRKVGTPAAALVVRIETDSAGKPSGTLVHANATETIAAADIDTSYGWVTGTFDGLFELSANTRYWIVFRSTGSAVNDEYRVAAYAGNDATYKRGNAATSPDSGTTWLDQATEDIPFKLKYGGSYGGLATILDIDYYKRFL